MKDQRVKEKNEAFIGCKIWLRCDFHPLGKLGHFPMLTIKVITTLSFSASPFLVGL